MQAATAVVVKKTKGMASVVTVGKLLRNCLYEMLKAASYNSGGRKIKNTISGFKAISGIPGIKPTAIPAETRRIGYGSFIFPAMADSPIIDARIKRTIL